MVFSVADFAAPFPLVSDVLGATNFPLCVEEVRVRVEPRVESRIICVFFFFFLLFSWCSVNSCSWISHRGIQIPKKRGTHMYSFSILGLPRLPLFLHAMIHCLVKRRLAPPPGHTRHQLSNEAVVRCDLESSSAATGILGGFAKVDHGEENNDCFFSEHTRSSCIASSSAEAASSRAEGATRQQLKLHESPSRDEEEHKSRIGEEEEPLSSLIGPAAHKLCVEGRKRLSGPYPRVSDVREARRASESLHHHRSPFEELLPRNSSKDRHRAASETEKFAYMSLDGRLMNAEMATSSTTIGLGTGGLLEKEARAWDAFHPLHRVLIVAVSAAAAAAAGKRQSVAEFCRLRNLVNARERELEVIRQKLSNLCSNQQTQKKSEALVVALEARSEEDSMDAACSVEGQQQPINGLCTDFSAEEGMAHRDVHNGVCLEEREAVVTDDTSEAKWYSNPMLQAGEHYFQMCTPEIDDPLFRNWTPQENFGWKSMMMQMDAGLLCAGTRPAVPQDQHLSDASEGEKVSTGRVTASTMEGVERIHLPHKSRRSGLGFPEDSTEELLGELESAPEKVAVVESQIKTMKHYATDSNANKKSSEVELEEWIDGDYENQVIACMEITKLRRQLHSQESEYKSLVRSCKMMLAVKSKEIAELREDCQRRDTALDDITAAARATRTASDEKIGVLEDLCRRKDTVIFDLKQDILALENKVHGLRTFQSPSMFCGRHSVTSLSPHQSDEHLAGSLSLPMSPKRFPHYLPPPGESARVRIIAESQKDCSSDGGDCSSLSTLPLCEDYVAAEKRLQAYRIDQESTKDFFSPPPSTIGDDFQELESSLLALSVEEERKIGSGQCTSSRRYIDISIPSTEEFRVIKESDFNTHHLPRRKTKPPVAFTDIFTVHGNASASTIVDDFMRTSCSSSSISMVSSGQKANQEPICSPRRSVEILRSVKTNTCYEPRRAISVDLGSSGFKSLARNEFKENVKQRRWQ